MMLPEFVYHFLDNFTSVHTRDAYANDIKSFYAFIQDKKDFPQNISSQEVVSFRDSIDASSATVNRRLSSVRSFLSWCVSKGILEHNPAIHVKVPKIATQKPTTAFFDNEAKAMIDAPSKSSFTGVKHRLMLAMLFNLGLRRSELVNIRLRDIQVDRGHTTIVVKGKGGKMRQVPMNDFVKVCFGDYISTYSRYSGTKLNQDDYLFQTEVAVKNVKPMNPGTVYRMVKRYADKLGIDRRVGAHSCRATVISHLLDTQKVPIRDVAIFAGHSDINTTTLYDKKRKGLDDSAAYKVGY